MNLIKSIYCSSARLSWSLESIAVVHHLGSVPAGNTSAFVVISFFHRDAALEACKYVIDELNASVPIFKKEVYSNGEVWMENRESIAVVLMWQVVEFVARARLKKCQQQRKETVVAVIRPW